MGAVPKSRWRMRVPFKLGKPTEPGEFVRPARVQGDYEPNRFTSAIRWVAQEEKEDSKFTFIGVKRRSK